MKRLFILVLTLLLLGATATAEDVQVPVFIDGVRVAFFDADGNFLMQKKADELVYVPLQSFCESLGMNAEVQGQSVSVDGMRIGMFDANGNFLSPKQFDGIDYVPLFPFCEAMALNASEEDGKIHIARESTTQVAVDEKKESTGKIALHPYNFGDYFSYDIQTQNFKSTQTRYNLNGGFLYSNEAEVDFVLTCNARSSFSIENVSFSVFADIWENDATASGISGISFSEDMPANGSLTKTEHKTGTALVSAGWKATKVSLKPVSLYEASGCIIVEAQKAETANLASYQKGKEYLKSKKYSEAKAIFSALDRIDYPNAKEMFDEVVRTEKEEKELVAIQAAQAKELAAAKAAQAKEDTYQSAVSAEKAGDYQRAASLFSALGEYKDSTLRYETCLEAIEEEKAAAFASEQERKYQDAVAKENANDYAGALKEYEEIQNYSDVSERMKTVHYALAEQACASGNREIAASHFVSAADFSDAADRAREIYYEMALICENCSNYPLACLYYQKSAGYRDGFEKALELNKKYSGMISAGIVHTVGLREDGTVIATGNNVDGACNVSSWKNVVSVSAAFHTVGLTRNATVVSTGKMLYNSCDTSKWKGIISVDTGKCQTIGLKSNGQLIAIGDSSATDGIEHLKDVIAIAAGFNHNVGLNKDGTVVAVDSLPKREIWNPYCGECDVSDWSDIVAIDAARNHTVGLKADGTVVTVGSGYGGSNQPSEWYDIIAISTSDTHIVGLKADGTVIATGANSYGECNTSDWRDIIAISAGGNHTVGLKVDGTVVATGNNEDRQCDVSGWKLFDSIPFAELSSETPAVEPSHTQYGTLKPGSKGQAVLDARMKLYELGYFSKKPTQTEYTSNMTDYVKRFEKDHGLKQDGILSPEDQEILFSL